VTWIGPENVLLSRKKKNIHKMLISMQILDFRMAGRGRQIVLTTDRSLLSNYRDNMLFGFVACMPAEKLSKFLYYHVFCPSVPADRSTGVVELAPLGLRRIESSLIEEYTKENVIISHCDYLQKSIGPRTEIVGINSMDPLGNSPLVTSIAGRPLTPYTRLSFISLMKRLRRIKEANGYKFKIVLGGGGAWQLLRKQERDLYGIDHVVIGEADDQCVNMFYEIRDGNAAEVMSVTTSKIVDIPYIQGPTINSSIEAMRGCGKGCDFCEPNRRLKRDFPIDRLKKEAKINLDYGHTCIWLMSEEIMLYGCDNKNLYPNRDAIVELYTAMKNLGKVNYVGAVHLTLASAVADPACIQKMREINNFGPGKWNAVQAGIETGSSRLIKKHMPYKSKPFSPDEWLDIVLEGTKVLNRNYLVGLYTLMIGLPGETDDDVQESINLIKDLDGTESVITPTLWTDYYHPENSFTTEKFTKLQWKLYYLCWKIDIKAIHNWISYGTAHFPPLVRQIAVASARLGTNYHLRAIRDKAKRTLGHDPDFDDI
jgi:radical SAM superfamily enzyme YgiQ (UPF0313 family)